MKKIHSRSTRAKIEGNVSASAIAVIALAATAGTAGLATFQSNARSTLAGNRAETAAVTSAITTDTQAALADRRILNRDALLNDQSQAKEALGIYGDQYDAIGIDQDKLDNLGVDPEADILGKLEDERGNGEEKAKELLGDIEAKKDTLDDKVADVREKRDDIKQDFDSKMNPVDAAAGTIKAEHGCDDNGENCTYSNPNLINRLLTETGPGDFGPQLDAFENTISNIAPYVQAGLQGALGDIPLVGTLTDIITGMIGDALDDFREGASGGSNGTSNSSGGTPGTGSNSLSAEAIAEGIARQFQNGATPEGPSLDDTLTGGNDD